VAGAKPASVAKPASKAMPKGVQRPYWDALNPAQKAALQPLAAEWDKQPNLPKKKWVEIANRFHTLTPDEQQRVHERMRDWIKLTPAQRALARDNYTRAKKLAPTGKSEQWQQYQQLPEAQKRKLAAEEANKKRPPVTTPPAKAGPPPLAPIKPGTTLPALLPPASVTEPARSGSSALRPAEQDRRGITVEALAPPNV
jgi:hypothetical protein